MRATNLPLTKREVLIGSATLIMWSGAMAALSEPSEAEVTTDSLDVVDGEYESPTGDIYSP